MIRPVCLAIAILTAAFSGAASAHQQKAALTEILFNPRTRNIEVAHRFVLHDAEHAARATLDLDGDLYASRETQAAFAAYVAERFVLSTPAGARLPLTLLGAEIDGGYIWVYQEAPAPVGLGALAVRHGALRDVWPEQVNRVNIKQGDEVTTLVFTGGAGELTAVLGDR